MPPFLEPAKPSADNVHLHGARHIVSDLSFNEGRGKSGRIVEPQSWTLTRSFKL